MAGTPFGSSLYPLGVDRAGRHMRLQTLRADDAPELARQLASIDPWRRIGWPATRLEALFSDTRPGMPGYLIRAGDAPAGVVNLEAPWLHGVYLRFLGILPAYQNAGIGSAVLDWFENEARGRHGNLWVCVSGFNERAAAFYEHNGYVRVAVLDDLIAKGEDEILLRKRI